MISKQNLKKVSPVISYYGSKFRLLDKIFSLLDLQENDIFLDLFGGSGIVGVNAKEIFNCKVIINDYDRILPLDIEYALRNVLSFEGNCKNYTIARWKYFLKRLDNKWVDKFYKYNDILKRVRITSYDYQTILNKIIDNTNTNLKPTKIYVDPPYFNKKGLYKSSFNDEQHIKLFKLLEILKPFSRIVISYNDSVFIRKLYSNWKIIEITKTNTSGIVKTKNVTELLITNV
ncbi:DNA adenine methylase [Mycoplasma putrefaciens]|uniref:Adenine-specific DNA methyltransferase n=1 Tax=Mycoplasma putrefaciens Mput9231 TaxID=1292033 RepID=M9WH48_9MOLU|nr:DNA adenine methylase [Mycoplasma putrefaciens]AGJ90714.1 Adenine-specific DNA methyltransferase [Mycoplasma putrefaciens Mput9231]